MNDNITFGLPLVNTLGALVLQYAFLPTNSLSPFLHRLPSLLLTLKELHLNRILAHEDPRMYFTLQSILP